jgi:hypothetical protein
MTKKPVKPPVSERTLTRYVAAYARESGVDGARVRRLISFMAIAGVLKQAATGDGEAPAFVVKDGVALELRLRDRARATKDLDLILNRDGGPRRGGRRDHHLRRPDRCWWSRLTWSQP